MHHSNHRIGFKSKFGAIAALAGSAVGLGNIWKFPYVAGTNGGGAFLLVYIFFTIAIGLPVMLAEFSLGRRSQQNALGTFRVLAPGTKWFLFGLLSIIAAALILSFYGTVSGWTLEYVWLSISNSFHGQSAEDIIPFSPISFPILTKHSFGISVLCSLPERLSWEGCKKG